MSPRYAVLAWVFGLTLAGFVSAQDELLSSDTLAGLKLRGIGPALMGGRIADLAVHPKDRSTWYAAVGSGGVWKSTNAGTTWRPIFDDQKPYSIGCVALDPSNPDVVWVGTGENVSGRHVGFGDGVYRSDDGGGSFRRMGLPRSEHISRIAIDPRDGNTVYVAAEGPLWSSGGERGLYKTANGGETWTRVLHVDADTGVTDVRLDPRNPDVVYAASYQRRRHVWSFLASGPGSGIHKSEDGGRTWRRIRRGLPKGAMGKIGLAVSPADPDVVYATIEGKPKERGFYRSRDRGESWKKRDSYVSGGTGPHYYQEIVASPHDVDVVYQMDVFLHVTQDGGESFSIVGDGRNKHSDNHALVIDPEDAEHLIAGSDASIYESFDAGRTWRQISNLPISQFYKVAVDDASPFTSVLVGAQDLGTLLGPLRTRHTDGVRNRDWYVPLGADGYGVAFEPGNSNVAYMEIQGGELYRYDRIAKELTDIKPQPDEGESPQRWNWDSPLLISPHAPSRLYFGSQRVWRSDDRGHSWKAVSGDLTRNRNRYEQRFYGRVWSVDALYDTRAMSRWGTTTTLSESPKVEGLLYVGTDDGLIQVSEDGGRVWRTAGTLPGDIAELAFVNDVQASLHDPDTVFAAVDAHKVGDYRPLLFESRDRGRSWQSIAGDLPADAFVWAIVQDHAVPDLLFAGTERGLFVTLDRGTRWLQLKGGMPPIAIRDLAIQRRDDDLVAASFGRGVFVLDDYSMLRSIRGAAGGNATLFPVRDAWWYVPYEPMQARSEPSLGSTSFRADNPPFGAVFTFYLPQTSRTAAQQRRREEDDLAKAGSDVPFPGWDTLAKEAREAKPFVLFTVRDDDGNVVRRLRAGAERGLHRMSWDLRRPAPQPIVLKKPDFRPPWSRDPEGPLVAPGRYTVSMSLVSAGGVERLGAAQSFNVKPVPGSALETSEPRSVAAFQQETAELLRRASGASAELSRVQEWLRSVRPSLIAAPGAEAKHFATLAAIERDLAAVVREFRGDPIRGRLNEPGTPGILTRLNRVARHWRTRQTPTATQRQSLAIARSRLDRITPSFRKLVDEDIPAFERALEKTGAPWTPRRRLK